MVQQFTSHLTYSVHGNGDKVTSHSQQQCGSLICVWNNFWNTMGLCDKEEEDVSGAGCTDNTW